MFNLTFLYETQRLTLCMNLLILRLFKNETIKSIFVINSIVDLAYPTTRFNITSDDTPLNPDVKPQLYLTNSNFSNLEDFLDVHGTTVSFNAGAKYGIINPNWHILHENFSSHHASKVVLFNSTEWNLKNLHGQYQFSPPVCSNHIINSQYSKPTNLMYCFSVIWRPYQNCNFNCGGKRGIFLDVVNMFAAHYNVTIFFQKCKEIGCRNIFREPSENKCGFLVSFLYLDNALMSFYPPWVDDYDFWFVPRQSEIPHWKYIFVSLPNDIWIAWIFTIVLVSVSKWIVQKVIHKSYPMHRILDVSILNFSIFLEQGVLMENDRISDILYFIVFLNAIFILNTVFKTRFTFLLLGSNYYADTISTIHDAAEHGFYVTYSRHLKKNLINRYREIEDYFLSRFIYADEENWTDLVAHNKNTVAMKSLINYKYIREKCLDAKGKPLIHMLTEPIQKSNYLFYYQRNHPLWSQFPYFINLLRDHGFLQIIELKYVTGDNIAVSDVEDVHSLGLSHMEGPFMIWILGHIVAILFFVFENVFEENTTLVTHLRKNKIYFTR